MCLCFIKHLCLIFKKKNSVFLNILLEYPIDSIKWYSTCLSGNRCVVFRSGRVITSQKHSSFLTFCIYKPHFGFTSFLFIIVGEYHKVLIFLTQRLQRILVLTKIIIILYMSMYCIASTNFRTYLCTYTYKPNTHIVSYCHHSSDIIPFFN